MFTQPERHREHWKATRIEAGSWFAYLIPLGHMPLEATTRGDLAETDRKLVNAIRANVDLQESVWLLLDELHREDAVQEISRNAAIWNPEPGVGVRPEGPSPRYLTSKDFLDRDFSTELPPMKQTVIGLETDAAGAQLACNLMAGRGGLIQALHHGAMSAVVQQWHDVIQPTIEEEGLAAYPLYVPLVSVATLRDASVLDRWLGPVEVYLRESSDDKGLLVVSRSPLEASLQAAGIQLPD